MAGAIRPLIVRPNRPAWAVVLGLCGFLFWALLDHAWNKMGSPDWDPVNGSLWLAVDPDVRKYIGLLLPMFFFTGIVFIVRVLFTSQLSRLDEYGIETIHYFIGYQRAAWNQVTSAQINWGSVAANAVVFDVKLDGAHQWPARKLTVRAGCLTDVSTDEIMAFVAGVRPDLAPDYVAKAPRPFESNGS